MLFSHVPIIITDIESMAIHLESNMLDRIRTSLNGIRRICREREKDGEQRTEVRFGIVNLKKKLMMAMNIHRIAIYRQADQFNATSK